MMFQVEVSWVVTPCGVVVGNRRFGEHCCSIFWVVTPCSVVGNRHFGEPCCSIFWVVTQRSVVLGNRRFGEPCCSIFWEVSPCRVVIRYQRFEDPSNTTLHGVTTQKTSCNNNCVCVCVYHGLSIKFSRRA